jgi:transcriptional regulator with XRE-family HTH domain
MRGYSLDVAEAIWNGDKSRLGVRLGSICLERRLPVVQVARALGVTRQTIYNWFTGAYDPTESHREAVERYIASFD